MRYDALMFVAMLTVLVASGVHALQPIVLEPQPISERVALLERDFEYLQESLKEIKQLIVVRNDETTKWLVIAFGLLVTGDRGWVILQRIKNNKNNKNNKKEK